MLIAPLDANTLAKIANGLCDNLLVCIIIIFSLDFFFFAWGERDHNIYMIILLDLHITCMGSSQTSRNMSSNEHQYVDASIYF